MDNKIHDTKRIGLIIQGPMLSSGVKGSLLRDKNSIKEKNDKNYVEFNTGEFIIGFTVLTGSFIYLPLFLYHRWKGKKLKDYTLNEENLKKMKKKI